MKNTYIKSPLNYVGGKYKLLPQILPLFPDKINTFVDLFGGGFNVGINVNADTIVYNDLESHVVELLKYLKETDTNSYGFQDNKADIELGKLCCFKPLDKDEIFFGHMAGKVVDDFENMTFMYVLNIDNRYFFSRNVIITPEDVHTSNDAKRYF